MSKWIEQLEAIIKKKELRPTGNWKTRLEIMDIIKCSGENSIKFLRWCEKTKKIKKNVGTSITCSRAITSKIFYKPIKKNWKNIYHDYVKSRQKLPEGKNWKTITQLCRDLKVSQDSARRAVSVLNKNKKIEIFKGNIVHQNGQICYINFYRLKE